ncbi:diguanylate cyclase [Maridesulfovibrio zosterae]|uniref:diguanylate cyclase n=1 Tax=Maridesulfovibrio zosterae TaxID=82171 RepID=UPI00042144F0|nr:diguanylate cyclase [Maridesulfovibrio zosterae]
MLKSDREWFSGIAIVCLAVIITGILVGELLIRHDAEKEHSLISDHLLNSGSLIAQDIQRNITHGIYATQTLETLLRINNFNTSDFDEWASQLVGADSGVSTVQLAPGGVVSSIYPLKGNEAAIGHDLLKDKRRNDGALKALVKKEITFVGPLKLIQNGKYAVIARKPVFRNDNGIDKFWGFSIALLLVNDILPSQLHLLEKQHILARIEGDDPDAADNPVFYQSKGWGGKDTVTMNIKVPNGDWILRLKQGETHDKYYNAVRAVLLAISLGIAIYIYIQQYSIRLKQKEILLLNKRLLEISSIDELTGVRNRRAGMQLLEYEIEKAKRYGKWLTIAMIDLDYFKQVNDEYGHLVGDDLLCHLADHLKMSIRKSDTVFRLGGDEFMIIFPQTCLSDCAVAVKNLGKNLKESPFKSGKTILPLQFSIGLAGYEADESLKSLLSRVDKKLYEAKEAGRDTVRY